MGLHLVRRAKSVADPGFVPTRNFDAGLVVAAVTMGSAAEQAGLAVGDLILEINGRNPNGGLLDQSREIRPGDRLRLRVRNASGERELQWVTGTRQELEWELVDLDKITPAQKARRTAWLKGEDQRTETAHS